VLGGDGFNVQLLDGEYAIIPGLFCEDKRKAIPVSCVSKLSPLSLMLLSYCQSLETN